MLRAALLPRNCATVEADDTSGSGIECRTGPAPTPRRRATPSPIHRDGTAICLSRASAPRRRQTSSKRELIVNVFLRQEGHLSADGTVNPEVISGGLAPSISIAVANSSAAFSTESGVRCHHGWANGLIQGGITLAPPTPSCKAALAVSERRIGRRCSEVMSLSRTLFPCGPTARDSHFFGAHLKALIGH